MPGDDAVPQVIHSPCGNLRSRVHVVQVHPEQPGNIGSTARALANCGIEGEWIIVAAPEVRRHLTGTDARRLSVHAEDRLDRIRFVDTLEDAWSHLPRTQILSIAASARTGSAARPHPKSVRPAVLLAEEKLRQGIVQDVFLVFGPESDGLSNADVASCDWVVSIPTAPGYRSLNLAQAVLIFSWEWHCAVMTAEADPEQKSFAGLRTSQRNRLVSNVVALAEEAGFVLPGDPHKMRAKLEDILGKLPPYLPEVRTLHGFVDQVRRSLRGSDPVYKGRYAHQVRSNHARRGAPSEGSQEGVVE